MFALLGYGYWGKKIYSVLEKKADVVVCDPNLISDKGIRQESLDWVLDSKKISHCFIAAPEETHYDLVKQCLESNKHVFVEKPLCLKTKQAEELVALAKSKKKSLYVDYIFLFDAQINKVKELLKKHKISKPKFIFSKRYSSGINKKRVKVTDDLVVHDLYLTRHFFDKSVTKATLLPGSGSQASWVEYGYGGTLFVSDYRWQHFHKKRELIIGNEKVVIKSYTDEKHSFIEISTKYKGSWKVEYVAFDQNNKSALELSIDSFLKKFSYPYSLYVEDTKMLELLRV